MDTYIYRLKGAIYINLTNRCTNDCTFCVRNEHNGVGGYNLRLEKEPSAKDIIAELDKQDDVSKIVFCGLGEPTMRIDVLIEVAQYLKGRGAHIRVNTNGQGSAYAGYDITTRMKGLIDTVSISLNAPSAKEYQKICQSRYGEQAYEHLQDFAKKSVEAGIETILSVVDIIGEQAVEECSAVASRIGAKFRVRIHID